MLLLVMLLLSALVASSSGHGSCDPSAHIEGGAPREASYTAYHVITAWDSHHSKSHATCGFSYAYGKLTVPRSGRYYVYAQMYFTDRPHNNNNRVKVYADGTVLLLIHKDMTAGQEGTGFAGGVFQLNAGQKIYVKISNYSTRMWLGPEHCFFGAYKLS